MSQPIPRTYPEGVPSWVDTEQADVDSALDFYGGVFGWDFVEATPSGAPFRYVIAQLDRQDVCGIGGPATPYGPEGRSGARPAWHTYIAVTDADAAAAAVQTGGGSVTQPPTDAGEGGRSVVCLDLAGVEFRLWQARRRLGSQVVNAPGAWNFSDLHAADPSASADFYTRMFGWAFDDVGFATLIRRPGYGAHLESTVDPGIRERQSVISAPVGFEDAIGWLAPAEEGETPHWHVTFTVADRDAAAAQTEARGGVVLASREDAWTRTALVRDPQGAVFTASQFMGG